MENPKTVSPAQGAEHMNAHQASKLIERDLKTARVICHLVVEHEGVLNALSKALSETVPNIPKEHLASDVKASFHTIGMIVANPHMISTLGDIAYDVHQAYEELKKNVNGVGNPQSN